jgi:hypothetical protein
MHLIRLLERVWDGCGRSGAQGRARRLATLMHAVREASPSAAAAIGKPASRCGGRCVFSGGRFD